jgi:hypothetical protein
MAAIKTKKKVEVRAIVRRYLEDSIVENETLGRLLSR